ncbi:Thioredoxin [Mycena venus]|uniref:Thioredoxin n=1 Tax=Mycena venus TaxID=2733690 RepID=A0A8H7CT47_9AGAR|nr:Thioredoxin [Mycena venus]
MPVTAIETFEEFEKVINGEKPVIIEFWATWCGPCRIISPVFEKFSNLAEYAGLGFYKVDIDANQRAAEEVGVRAMPTFIVFKGGEKLDESVGANIRALQQLIGNASP